MLGYEDLSKDTKATLGLLDIADLREVAKKLLYETKLEQKDVDFIKGFVTSRDPAEGPCVEDRKKKVMEEYSDSVFCGRTAAEPPVRGPLGESEIILKSGVTPTKQRAFSIAGERIAAWIRLTDQLLLDGKI